MNYSKEALRKRIYNPDDTYELWGNLFESHILSSGTILSTTVHSCPWTLQALPS